MTDASGGTAVLVLGSTGPESFGGFDTSGAETVVGVLTQTLPAEWIETCRLLGEGVDPYVVDLTGTSGSSLRIRPANERVVAGLERTDLTGVCIALASFLERRDGPVLVYFESLPTLVLTTGVERTGAFLRAVRRAVVGTGGTLVVDVDPVHADDPRFEVVTDLFDRTVRSRASP